MTLRASRAKQTSIRQRAIVNEVRKGDIFLCRLVDNPDHKVLAKPCGRMQTQRIIICIGDEVTLEITPYDLTRGRIIWRS